MKWLFAAGFFSIACIRPFVVAPPPEPLRASQTRVILDSLLALGMDGDWLVTRGYNFSDHMVATATNIPLSHVAVLDLGKGEAIEAHGVGVEILPLEKFVDKSHRVILVRPLWARDSTRAPALARARALNGRKYDYLGTLGFNFPERFYCSELAIYMYRPYFSPNEKFPAVIEPGQLYLWGRELYDSRPRDEAPR